MTTTTIATIFYAYVFFSFLMTFFIFAEQSEANHCEAASFSKPHAILVSFYLSKVTREPPIFFFTKVANHENLPSQKNVCLWDWN